MKITPLAPRSSTAVLTTFRPWHLAMVSAFAACVTILPAHASDMVGVYAYIDKVMLEPDASAPERIQIWGGFALAKDRGNIYEAAQRGVMYFKVKPGKESVCRKEWNDLKSVAGTNQLVAFGQRYSDNGTVRKPDAKLEKPDTYVTEMGVQKIEPRDYAPLNDLLALKKKASQTAPAAPAKP